MRDPLLLNRRLAACHLLLRHSKHCTRQICHASTGGGVVSVLNDVSPGLKAIVLSAPDTIVLHRVQKRKLPILPLEKVIQLQHRPAEVFANASHGWRHSLKVLSRNVHKQNHRRLSGRHIRLPYSRSLQRSTRLLAFLPGLLWPAVVPELGIDGSCTTRD